VKSEWKRCLLYFIGLEVLVRSVCFDFCFAPKRDFFLKKKTTNVAVNLSNHKVVSYFWREILTPCLWLAAYIWPQLQHSDFRKFNEIPCRLWTFFCLTTGVFLWFPVEKREEIGSIEFGGCLILISGLIALFNWSSLTERTKLDGQTSSASNRIIKFQVRFFLFPSHRI